MSTTIRYFDMKSSMRAVKRSAMGEWRYTFALICQFIETISLLNRPYDNRWSKTMIGYGPESTHFVLELTYNYGVKSYELGMQKFPVKGTY